MGNTEQEVFAAGAAAVGVAAAGVAGPHRRVLAAEVEVAAVGLVEVEAGCQENAAVESAAVGPLLLARAVALGEVALAQDQVALTVVVGRVKERATSLYPVAVVPCLVAIHWSL